MAAIQWTYLFKGRNRK